MTDYFDALMSFILNHKKHEVHIISFELHCPQESTFYECALTIKHNDKYHVLTSFQPGIELVSCNIVRQLIERGFKL
jgi:hypothetical protein